MNYFDQIKEYVHETLDEESRISFINELRYNLELKEAVESYQIHAQIFDHLAEQQLHKELSTILLKKKHKQYWKYGIIGILTIVGIVLVLLKLNSQNPAQLYVEYYQTPIISTNIRGNIHDHNELDEALSLFGRNEFEESIKLLNNVSDDDLKFVKTYYLAHALLNLDRDELAIEEFRKLINNDSQFMESSQWYLGLTYLKIGELKEAKFILKPISLDVNHNYSKKALSLLESKIWK